MFPRWLVWVALVACVALLALILVGCSGTQLGPDPTPRVGRYAYSFQAEGLTASGTMHLDYSAPDSIAGRFEVPGYETTFQQGFFNAGGWIVWAMPLQGGIAEHKLRLEGDELRCGNARYFVSEQDTRFATCETIYQGP